MSVRNCLYSPNTVIGEVDALVVAVPRVDLALEVVTHQQQLTAGEAQIVDDGGGALPEGVLAGYRCPEAPRC